MDVRVFSIDLLVVLVAGFLAGAACKRLRISLLAGYLIAGALIGGGALGLVTQENRELEYLARAGALLLLFSIGIEFSLEELLQLSRYFFIGGCAQMVLVAVPLTGTLLALGMSWNAAILIGCAGALSSTVLVFKALAEWGQTATGHGRRAIGILLFQDVALVPLMLLVPLLTKSGVPATVAAYAQLAVKSMVFVVAVVCLRVLLGRWAVPALARVRSVEIVVLFAVSVLGSICWAAFSLGMSPAIGALAAGIVLGGNRLSKQVDTIILPFRETFSAVFFVTLGTLFDPLALLRDPLLLLAGLLGMLMLKWAAAAFALRLIGLRWAAATGMGLGLAQLGEFSFLLLADGAAHQVISTSGYNRMLFIALATLILTPQLLKFGLRWTEKEGTEHAHFDAAGKGSGLIDHAAVIGVGPVGRRIASRLETMGTAVCLVDLSPINLHAFAQQGLHTVAGDARDPEALRRARVDRCRLAVVCLPDDDVTNEVVRAVRELNPTAHVFVRCHYEGSVDRARRAGGTIVMSEEGVICDALLRRCEMALDAARKNSDSPSRRNAIESEKKR